MMERTSDRIVERLGLFARLRKALAQQVACVAAPAGYGKTTLVRNWLDFQPQTHQAIWLTVGADDDEPASFYRRLCAAFIGHGRTQSAAFAAAPTEHALRLLRKAAETERADTASINPRRFLVLDDAHLLTHRELLSTMPEVVRNLPDSCRVIFIGRGGPLFIHVAEAFPSAERIGANDLRFSAAEIARCFELHGRKLSRAEASGVFRHTGGWPIAVVLLAGQKALPNWTGRDKLLERAMRQTFWNGCSPSFRTFLLKTCVVDELTPALCARLTDTDEASAAKTLEEVAHTSLLTRASGDETGWRSERKYLHHDLFLHFLRARLAEGKERPDIDRAALHTAAAEHYFDLGNAYRAIHHALASGESKIVSRAMHEAVRYDAHNNSIAAHVDKIRAALVGKLSEEALARHPYLHATLAWYFHLTGDAKAAAAEFDRLYEAMPEIAERHGEFLEMAALSYVLDHRFPGGNFFVRVAPEIREKLGRRRLQFPGMAKNLPFAHKGAKDLLDLPGIPENTEQLARAAPLWGDSATALTNAICAGLWLERDEPERSLACARAAEAALPDDAVPDMVFTTMMAADEWLASYFVDVGTGTGKKNDRKPLELFRIFQHLTTARALMVRAPVPETRDFLERLVRLAEDFRRTTDRAESLTLLAVFEWHRGVRGRASGLLEEAVRSVYPYRYVRIFADEGAALLPVLSVLERRLAGQKGPKSPAEPELLRHVRKIRLAAYARSRRHKGLAWTMEAVPAALSPQQLKLLSLLAEGYSRQEVQAALGIKPTSFKTQARRACRKLEADSLDEALARARELGMI